MRQFYSPVVGPRHLLVIVLVVTIGCGGAPVSTAPLVAKPVLALLQQAEKAERARDYHTARERYQKAIAVAPDPTSAALANRKMASALLFWGEYEGAERRLMQSLVHDGTQVRVWHDLAIVQVQLKKHDAALASLVKAVELAPGEPRIRVAYAALLVKERRYRDAITQYKHLLTLSIPPTIEQATHKALRMLAAEVRDAE